MGIKTTYKPVEQTESLEINPVIDSQVIFDKISETLDAKSLQQKVMGKLDIYIQKNETRPLSLTTYKKSLKMEYRFKCKT